MTKLAAGEEQQSNCVKVSTMLMKSGLERVSQVDVRPENLC